MSDTNFEGFKVLAPEKSKKHTCDLPPLAKVGAMVRGTVIVCEEVITKSKKEGENTVEYQEACGRRWKLNMPRKLWTSIRTETKKKKATAAAGARK